jgi:hypothetical protein
MNPTIKQKNAPDWGVKLTNLAKANFAYPYFPDKNQISSKYILYKIKKDRSITILITFLLQPQLQQAALNALRNRLFDW